MTPPTTFSVGKFRVSIGNTAKFAIVFVVVGLHSLGALSLPLYLVLYVPTVVVVVLQYAFGPSRRSIVSGRLFSSWIFIAVCAFAVSMAIISLSGAVQGLVRFLFAAPLFLALVLYTDSVEQLRRHLVTAVGFFVFASLTLPLQFLTGPIDWFSPPSYRDGLVRYSSLVGSLTSIGIVVGSYIVLTQAAKSPWRWLWLGLMIIPAILSLQKAAYVNIVLGLVLLAVLNRHAWKRILVVAAALAVLAAAGYALVPTVRDRVAASLLSFGIGSGTSSGVPHDDVSTWVSAWDRLTIYPLSNIDALANLHSPLVYLTGGGFGMASTALVPSADSIAPEAHNQFAEMFTVFGVVGGIAQLVILAVIGYLLWRRLRATREPILLAIFFAYVLFLLNSVFANGTLYQPASAAILFIAMFAATSSLFDEKLAPGQVSRAVNRTLRALAGLPRLAAAPTGDAANFDSVSPADVVDA